ncbi:hypothetical protein KP509_10G003300 [Ceratopteris richardii]|uniref:Beta-fructofuranosidase n=2 Tax=Ceratopteris richardii TaxID=49495 RepID=A0A8T2TSU4_CERRI|nr:hypothetical protein KP509_10G003300 [Ceratopteris richardii]
MSPFISVCACCWFFVAASASRDLTYRDSDILSLNTAQRTSEQPYRTGFHFQPTKNWMNDPNGLMYYKGYYHLFYQWNPYGAVWGTITWGHAVSTDMLQWHILDVALAPDQWYDINGCWTGSATFVAANRPVLIYTGWTNISSSVEHKIQVQAVAVPHDSEDPLLQKWIKVNDNPILVAPIGIDPTEFRDPTTAWIGADGKWRMVVGSKRKEDGVALLYRSSDFLHWHKAEDPLHSVVDTGMWECPDFYPVSIGGQNGLDTSVNGPDVIHVLKASLANDKHDYYVVGTYNSDYDTFTPADSSHNVGIGLRYDYGKFYASKTFYDSAKGRRILFGWVNESSSAKNDIVKGWSSLQGFPRKIWLNGETKSSILQWPIQEIETLRRRSDSLSGIFLEANSVTRVTGVEGAQLDVEVEFDMPSLNEAEILEVDSSNVQLACSQVGKSHKGAVGPFGLLVLASEDLKEQTAVFFYAVLTGGGWKTLICSDQGRSSLNNDVDKTSYGSYMSVPSNDKSLRLRTLVDHSIVETFAQGGEICITSRVYPVKAVNNQAHLYLFNNGVQY